METVNAFFAWLDETLRRPFDTPMSPLTVFLVVGAIIVSIVLWNLVLYHIRMAAQEVV